jgi:hypothetical protein
MIRKLRMATVVLILATACLAQDGLTVRDSGKHALPAGEAERIYLSACSTVQRQFGGRRTLRPQIALVLGAQQNQVEWNQREIRLVKWDPHLFAQGVVMLAFEELMPTGDRLDLARRAVSWADSTIEVGDLHSHAAMLERQADPDKNVTNTRP